MDLVEVLSFLFMLSTMELGRVSHSMVLDDPVAEVGDTFLTPRNIPRTLSVKHKRRCWRTFEITDSSGKERFGGPLPLTTMPQRDLRHPPSVSALHVWPPRLPHFPLHCRLRALRGPLGRAQGLLLR